ncbi:unnamed protein product [Effrenium voratum]|nr:unnamed protein product [Effrenium voratum]
MCSPVESGAKRAIGWSSCSRSLWSGVVSAGLLCSEQATTKTAHETFERMGTDGDCSSRSDGLMTSGVRMPSCVFIRAGLTVRCSASRTGCLSCRCCVAFLSMDLTAGDRELAPTLAEQRAGQKPVAHPGLSTSPLQLVGTIRMLDLP